MEQVELFVAAGPPTGVGNMLSCFHWLKPSLRLSLLLVHLVRIIAGVGRTGSFAPPGGDPLSSVSPSQVFLPL
jgi:hypothetical protein